MGAPVARPRCGASLLNPGPDAVAPPRSPRVRLVPLSVGHAPAMLELRRRSGEHLGRREPLRRSDYLTLGGQEEELRDVSAQRAAGRGYAFGIFADGELVGRVALTNVIRGAFDNAYLGYFVGHEFNRRGYATEAVQGALEHAFGPLRLHRVQAAVMLDNPASMRVLAKAGFRREGLARRYLCIHGRWEDHMLFAITAEEPRPGLDRAEGTEPPAIL